ncbi:MAG: hypothetical protein ABIK89_03585 [Planctomycetota bacterium]
MNLNGLLPIAAMEDWIFPLVVVLFLIISGVGQVLAKVREGQEAERRRQQAGQRPRGARPARPPARDPLREEVGQFLRGPENPRAANALEPVAADLVPDDRSVADHVRQGLGTERFDHLRPELTGEVALADDRMAEHVHDVFDHEVSRLAGTPGESASLPGAEEAGTPDDRVTLIPATAAAGLAAMLADPGSLRQAIVLNEILQRPEERWQ